jgi:hypothetical protein
MCESPTSFMKTRAEKINQLESVLGRLYPEPLGIYDLDIPVYENEVRVEYTTLPYINRDVTKNIESAGFKFSGLNTNVKGGSESGRAGAYLFLELL